MQHPDEGTIHSWLDDALGVEEAARVESHVAECAECAAKVAEARGFIAASSRILTALDDVPAGVIPIAKPRVARFGPGWRAAAAVLVVAGGSLLVLRNNEKGQDAVTAATTPSAPGPGSAAPPAPESRRSAVTQSSAAPGSERVAETTMEWRDAAKAVDMQRVTAGTGRAVTLRGAVAGVQGGTAGASTIRLLSESSGTGSRSFRYAVGGSDTVTLTEVAQVARLLNEGRVQTPSAPLPAPPPPPVSAASQAAPTAGAAVDRAETAPVSNTIRWVDSATGKTLTLSGKLSVARLEEIRRQIERQRAITEKQTP